MSILSRFKKQLDVNGVNDCWDSLYAHKGLTARIDLSMDAPLSIEVAIGGFLLVMRLCECRPNITQVILIQDVYFDQSQIARLSADR